MHQNDISASQVANSLYKRRGLRPIAKAPPTPSIKEPVVPEFNTTFTQRLREFFGHIWALMYWMAVFIQRHTPILKPLDEQETPSSTPTSQTSTSETPSPINTEDEYTESEDDLENDPDYLPENDSDETDTDEEFSEDPTDDEEVYSDVGGEVTDEESVFLSEQCPDAPTKRMRPGTHPVIYGMGPEYRSSMSSREKRAQIDEAFDEDSIPTDCDDAWDFFKNNPQLAEKYRVQNYC